jgi:hypothetical protein
MPTDTLYVVGITRAIMRAMGFFQLQVTRRKPNPINYLRSLNGFLTRFLTVALLLRRNFLFDFRGDRAHCCFPNGTVTCSCW